MLCGIPPYAGGVLWFKGDFEPLWNVKVGWLTPGSKQPYTVGLMRKSCELKKTALPEVGAVCEVMVVDQWVPLGGTERQDSRTQRLKILDAAGVGNSQGQDCLWGEQLQESDDCRGGGQETEYRSYSVNLKT